MTNKPAKTLTVPVLIALVAGCCVSSEQAQVNRDNRLAKQFPDPADRKGMYIFWQSTVGKFNVEYLANDISEATALSRIVPLGQKLGQGTDARLVERRTAMNRNVTLGDGSTAPARAFKLDYVLCFCKLRSQLILRTLRVIVRRLKHNMQGGMMDVLIWSIGG